MGRYVFISHSHKDREAADALLAHLESHGVSCWISHRDVPPGGSYAEALLNAIEGASCFVLVFTQHANVSPHVLREVERALKFGINIIPVRFDDSEVSKSLDYLLATVHWLSALSEPRAAAVRAAADRIAAAASPGVVHTSRAEGHPPVQEQAAVKAPEVKRKPRAVLVSKDYTIGLFNTDYFAEIKVERSHYVKVIRRENLISYKIQVIVDETEVGSPLAGVSWEKGKRIWDFSVEEVPCSVIAVVDKGFAVGISVDGSEYENL